MQAEQNETRAALRQLAVVAGCFALVAGATYAHVRFERFRPWVPGEPIPVLSAFTRQSDALMPEFAGSGSGFQRLTDAPEDDAPIDGVPIDGVPEAQDASGVTPPEPDVATMPASGQQRTKPHQPLEDASEKALDRFFARLAQTAKGQGLTRISHYGDSNIATDLLTYTARRRLQKRFGDGGHGFVLISKGHMPYRHRDVRTWADKKKWWLQELVREELGESGWYGYGGVRFGAYWGADAVFKTSEDTPVGQQVSRFQVYYEAFKRGGILEARIDDGEPVEISMRSETREGRVWSHAVPLGAHELRIRFKGKGQARLYGVALETDGPGVVYDSLGLVGARARRMLNFDPAHLKQQLALRETHLVVLGFGGNDASDPIGDGSAYYEDFRKVIQVATAEHAVDCIVFAPLDQAERSTRGRIKTMASVPIIVDAQRRAAKAEGCAFFDTFAAMGGKGAMRRWYRQRPKLAFGDLRHATPAGYEKLARYFTDALLASFASFQARTSAGVGSR